MRGDTPPARFIVRTRSDTSIRGPSSPSAGIGWSRTYAFSNDPVNGLGRRERYDVSPFPQAKSRYALACRGAISDGPVLPYPGVLPHGGLDTSSSRLSTPSSTQLRFDALLGEEALHSSKSPPALDQMRSWVNAAAPPLVYDGARARHERQSKLAWRDELAAKWHAKAIALEAEKPPPPPSHRMLREQTLAKLMQQQQQSRHASKVAKAA